MAGHASKPVALLFLRDRSRRYAVWEGIINGEYKFVHGFGALFAEGYQPSSSPEASIWHCPIRTCGQIFAMPPDLGDHFLSFHSGAILHDHLDGTFSVLPRDAESANNAKHQPYVVSQGRMLQSQSLRQPSHSAPLQSGPGALDTPAMPVDQHDKSKPQTGNKLPASSSEVKNDDESDGCGDNETDGSDADESDGDHIDESDGNGDNESDGSDTDESDGDADETKDEVGHKKANETKLQSSDSSKANSDESGTSDDESSGSNTDQEDEDKAARANTKITNDHNSNVVIEKEDDTDTPPPATSLTKAAEDDKQRTNLSNCKYTNSEIWKYITSFTADFLPVPADPCLLELLILPRQRDLPYCWKNWLNSRKPSLKTLTAVALYLSGVQRNTPCGDIMRCGDFRDLYDELHYYGDKNAPDFHPDFPFDTCIQLPDYLRQVSPALEERLRGYYCCNVFYRRTKELPMPDAFVDSSMLPHNTSPKKRKADNPVAETEPKKAKLEQTSGSHNSASLNRQRGQDHRLSDNIEQPAAWEISPGTLLFAGQKQWGKPGLAFSSNFLLKKRRVADDDTTFQLVKVPPTNEDRYHEANSHRSFLFAVKDGVVNVKVSGEKNFTISSGGCWNLKPGQHCSIRNQSSSSEASVFVISRLSASAKNH